MTEQLPPMPDPTEPSTWAFLMPAYWANRVFDAKPIAFDHIPITAEDSANIEIPDVLFLKPSRYVHSTFWHCSASDNPKHDNVETIRRWHTGKGWRDIGYHGFINTAEGRYFAGRHLKLTPAAQGRSKKSKGKSNNPNTLAYCVSGKSVELFTEAQMATVLRLSTEINEAYSGDMRFRGHREVSYKACPVFGYKELLGLDAEGRMTGKPIAA